MIKDISLDTIYNEDCLETMRRMPDNYLAAIVTDPPYGISFMGKKWDYDVPSVEIWQEALRILKPGGHLLSFAGTRTYHRMAVRIEDAGFEIRDMIEWVYGSGFPKSLNIGLAIDKKNGVIGNRGTAINVSGKGDRKDIKTSVSKANGTLQAGYTDAQNDWNGYGTALKPAHEPCVLARKPIEGTVAQNVLKHGTGGLNMDSSRITTSESLNGGAYSNNRETSTNKVYGEYQRIGADYIQPQGRFPANLIHDGSDEVVGLFPNTKSGAHKTDNVSSDSAARFFYTAKASKSERGESNNHPTVKPVKLMEYLIKLVIPPNGGVIYDPFSGSGTTLLACQKLCISYIGSEISKEYCDIAERRLGQGVLL